MKGEPRDTLTSTLERNDLTIEELVERADGLLDVLAPKQTRYKVTDRPDVRTIRYYTSASLLPKPVSYEGGRARYSGGHLIRVLLIKKLQAQHHSLAQIARVLRGASNEEVLEALFPASAPVAPKTRTNKPPRESGKRTETRLQVADRLISDSWFLVMCLPRPSGREKSRGQFRG